MEKQTTEQKITVITAPEQNTDNASSCLYWKEKLHPFINEKYKHIRITFKYHELNPKRTFWDKIFSRNHVVQKQFTTSSSVSLNFTDKTDKEDCKLRIYLRYTNGIDFFQRNPVTKEVQRIPHFFEMEGPNWMTPYVDIMATDIVEIQFTE